MSKSSLKIINEATDDINIIDVVVNAKDFTINLMITLFTLRLLILGIIKPPE